MDLEDFDIDRYLDYYSRTQGLLPEKLEEYRGKQLSRQDLYELAYEASTRSAHHVRKNPEKLCDQVINNLERVEGDFSKIALLTSLKGFKAPTASVILTVLNPERHAVVDTRVWASLERLGFFNERKESFDAFDYVKMIEKIRKISKEKEFSTEEVGYALFALDVEKREASLH
ncbi:MAG: hypothetical protein ACLFTA_00075 [Candidatus Nanohaloarchaea archaeon]